MPPLLLSVMDLTCGHNSEVERSSYISAVYPGLCRQSALHLVYTVDYWDRGVVTTRYLLHQGTKSILPESCPLVILGSDTEFAGLTSAMVVTTYTVAYPHLLIPRPKKHSSI